MCAQVNFDIAVLILFKHVKDHHPQNLFLLLNGFCCVFFCLFFSFCFVCFVVVVCLVLVLGGGGEYIIIYAFE